MICTCTLSNKSPGPVPVDTHSQHEDEDQDEDQDDINIVMPNMRLRDLEMIRSGGSSGDGSASCESILGKP